MQNFDGIPIKHIQMLQTIICLNIGIKIVRPTSPSGFDVNI